MFDERHRCMACGNRAASHEHLCHPASNGFGHDLFAIMVEAVVSKVETDIDHGVDQLRRYGRKKSQKSQKRKSRTPLLSFIFSDFFMFLRLYSCSFLGFLR